MIELMNIQYGLTIGLKTCLICIASHFLWNSRNKENGYETIHVENEK